MYSRTEYHPTKAKKIEIQKKAADGIIDHKKLLSLHTFPVRNKDLCDKWKAAISFMHLEDIKNFSRVGMYQLHFLETDYKDGGIVHGGAVRKRRVVKEGNVPSAFPGVLKILQKTCFFTKEYKACSSFSAPRIA